MSQNTYKNIFYWVRACFCKASFSFNYPQAGRCSALWRICLSLYHIPLKYSRNLHCFHVYRFASPQHCHCKLRHQVKSCSYLSLCTPMHLSCCLCRLALHNHVHQIHEELTKGRLRLVAKQIQREKFPVVAQYFFPIELHVLKYVLPIFWGIIASSWAVTKRND